MQAEEYMSGPGTSPVTEPVAKIAERLLRDRMSGEVEGIDALSHELDATVSSQIVPDEEIAPAVITIAYRLKRAADRLDRWGQDLHVVRGTRQEDCEWSPGEPLFELEEAAR